MVMLQAVETALGVRSSPLCVLDVAPLADSMDKIIKALVALNTDNERLWAELGKLKQENGTMKEEMQNQVKEMKDWLEKVAMKIGAEDVVETIAARVTLLESKLQKYQLTENAVSQAEFIRIQQSFATQQAMVDENKENLNSMQNDMRTQNVEIQRIFGEVAAEKIERKKVVNDVDSDLQNLKLSFDKISTDLRKMETTKANKSDISAVETMASHALEKMTEVEKSNKAMQTTLETTTKSLDQKLKLKADLGLLADKLGRVECEEFLQGLASRLGLEMHKTGKMAVEMREELDFVLTTILQKQSQASGTSKCISCSKAIPAIHKPGALPLTGRSPVLMMGEDNKFYRRRESLPDTASEAEQFIYTPHWPKASNSSPRPSASSPIRETGGIPPSPPPQSAFASDSRPPPSSSSAQRPKSARVTRSSSPRKMM